MLSICLRLKIQLFITLLAPDALLGWYWAGRSQALYNHFSKHTQIPDPMQLFVLAHPGNNREAVTF